MLALFRSVQRTLGIGLVAAVAVLGGSLIGPTVDAASCGFQCNIVYNDAAGAASSCTTSADCVSDCRQQCQAQGWTAAGEPTCSTRAGRDGFRVCTGCSCLATTRTPVACEMGAAGDVACTTECQTNVCNTRNLRVPLTGQANNVLCRTASPAPRCVTSQVDVCRSCVQACLNTTGATGARGTPTDCYGSCQRTLQTGQTVPACQDVPVERAIEGFTSAPDGAVSGTGDRRSRVQSAVTASAREAASLGAGECVRRAIQRDPANESLVQSAATALNAPRETWLCKRICSTQQGERCVSGGCPGDETIRCCPPDLGIRPLLLCNEPAAPDTGAPGATTNPTSGGAAPTPSAPSAPSTGLPESSVVGAANISADSGGLTRLILPACIENGGCQFSDMIQVGLNLVRFLFGLAGVLLLIVFIYAGVEYLIAGDASSVKSAEDRIGKALKGLFFMFFGYTLVNFLVGVFIRG